MSTKILLNNVVSVIVLSNKGRVIRYTAQEGLPLEQAGMPGKWVPVLDWEDDVCGERWLAEGSSKRFWLQIRQTHDVTLRSFGEERQAPAYKVVLTREEQLGPGWVRAYLTNKSIDWGNGETDLLEVVFEAETSARYWQDQIASGLEARVL